MNHVKFNFTLTLMSELKNKSEALCESITSRDITYGLWIRLRTINDVGSWLPFLHDNCIIWI